MQNDLISRSVLKEKIHDFVYGYRTPKISKGDLEHGLNKFFVDKAPAVDAVVLPVKPGSVVWILDHRFSAEIEEVCIREDGVFAVWVEYDRSPELTEVWDNGEFDIKEIGKTVFLTVEELEKAETEG